MKRRNIPKVRLAMTLAGLGFLPGVAFGAITPSQMPGGGAVIATNTGTTVDGAGAGSSITGLNPGATVSLSNTSNHTAFAVIRWGGASAPADATNAGGFNIGSTAALTFASSRSGGAVLNIDASGNPSEIDGALTGNNTAIYVANENGIVIGPSAAISLPQGGAFLAWNMDNTTAVQEFVGNNSTNSPYLDIGKLSTPGNITIDKGANITAGSTQVLISGADVVNSGDITVGPTTANYSWGSITIAAGWRPIKQSDTVNGTSSTATYRISSLLGGSGGALSSRGVRSFEPGTSAGFSGTFTNNGVISSTTAANSTPYGSMVILSQSGMANFGTLETTNQSIGIYNTFNDVALNGTIDAPSVGTSLPGVSYVAQTTTGTSRSYQSYSESLMVVDPYAKILLGDVYNVNGTTVTANSHVAAGSMALAGYDIQGLNGTTPISANSLYLAATANINAPGSSNYLKNGLGIQPLVSGQTVDLHLIPAGAASGNYNVVNLNVQGNAIVDSIAQTPVSEAVDQTGYTGPNGTYYNSPAQTDSSGNYGSAPAGYTASYTDPTAHASSMLIQATGNMTITAPNYGYNWPGATSYASLYNITFAQQNSGNNSYWMPSQGAPFAFSGGIALDAGATLTVNVPMINAWGSNAGVPFQGFYLEGQAITIANDAWFMSNYDNVVNVSSTPSGNSTGSYVPNVYWMVGGVSNPPSSVNASFGTAVFNNTYTTTVANAATYPTSWAQMQSNTPLPATQ